MSAFCPKCHLECFVNSEGRSSCCDQPAFIGCSRCGKRLVQLAMVALPAPLVGDRDYVKPGALEPVLCYACFRKERKI